MNSDLLSRVKRGAMLLDEKLPGWHNRVNPDVLNINDCSKCVIGQLACINEWRDPVEFERAVKTIFGREYGWDVNNYDVQPMFDLGLDCPRGNGINSRAVLTIFTAMWRDEINMRRSLDAELAGGKDAQSAKERGMYADSSSVRLGSTGPDAPVRAADVEQSDMRCVSVGGRARSKSDGL